MAATTRNTLSTSHAPMITSSVRMDRAEWKRARECRPRYALLPLAALGKTIDETKLPTATAAVHSDSTAIRIRARIKTLEALQCGPLKRAPAPLRAGALGRRGDDRANRAFTPRIGSQRLARLEFCAGFARTTGTGLRNVRGGPLPCVTSVSTMSNLGLPRSVTR